MFFTEVLSSTEFQQNWNRHLDMINCHNYSDRLRVWLYTVLYSKLHLYRTGANRYLYSDLALL